MQYQLEWLDMPWLMKLTVTGALTLPEYETMMSEQLTYYNAVDGNLYIICDVRKTSMRIDARLFSAILRSPTLQHVNCGIVAFIGKGPMLRFLLSATIQRAVNGGRGESVHMFPTFQEADAFCRLVAAVDIRRAAHYTPLNARV